MKTILIYFWMLIFLAYGCTNESIVNSNNLEVGNISFSLDKNNAPEDVVEVIVYLTREGFETKVLTMDLTSNSSAKIAIEKLKIGYWHLLVQALDKNGNVLYSGETDVNVQSNIIVPVNLQLNSTTGGIELNVTWGDAKQDKIVAYYPFLGNANDLSSYGNNGIVYGAKLTEDRFGNRNSAYLFDGIDDFIRIPDANSLTPTNQKLTIAVWFKIFDTRGKSIMYKGSKNNNREYSVGVSYASKAGFAINNNGLLGENQIGINSKINIDNDKWYFLVGVWNGSEIKIYVNGKLENTKTVNVTIGNFDSDLFIGAYGGDIEKYAFKGVIDDIRIYNSALSDEKIQELFYENGWIDNTGWIDYADNPIISGNEVYPNAMQSIIFRDNDLYKMYFIGHSSKSYEVYLATSSDGLTWEKYGNTPVLKKGEPGNWDDRNVSAGAIIKKDNHYFMYYNGRSIAGYPSAPWHIGLAISQDGITWEKYNAPIIDGDPNSWDRKIGVNDVKIISGTYYMFYSGMNGINDKKIGLAISDDGINWKKYKNNPIMIPTEKWEGSGIYCPSIILENNKFKMVYQNSYNNFISGFGMAYSTDGINWTKDTNNPIFTENNTKNNYSMILYPNFQKTENEYRIYYTGKNSSTGKSSVNIVTKKF